MYYAVCDVILISQVYYYRHKRANYPHLYLEPLPSETDPLLSSLSAPIPASNPKARVIRDIASYVGGFALVVIVGVVAWKSSEGAGEGGTKEEWSFKGQVLGWSSAFLYREFDRYLWSEAVLRLSHAVSSRIPQIYKNTQTKCQGLSLLMFAFALCGNATYVAVSPNSFASMCPPGRPSFERLDHTSSRPSRTPSTSRSPSSTVRPPPSTNVGPARRRGGRFHLFITRCHSVSPHLTLVFFVPQSILLVSVEPEHLSINASWLVGSGGTIFLDMIVLTQVRSL